MENKATVKFMVDLFGNHQASVEDAKGARYQIVQIGDTIYWDIAPWTKVSTFSFAENWRAEHRFFGAWDQSHFRKMIFDFVSFTGSEEVQYA